MDIRENVREIGAFEVAKNLSIVLESADGLYKLGAFMPLPGTDIEKRTADAAKFLLHLGKKKYMFLTPEIALTDVMADLAGHKTESLFVISSNLEKDAKLRLCSNLPHKTTVSVLDEPSFPKDFFPNNGVIVVCGYEALGRAMVLEDTYRMVEHYRGFLGKKVFLPYATLNSAIRYDGWREIYSDRVDLMWNSSATCKI